MRLHRLFIMLVWGICLTSSATTLQAEEKTRDPKSLYEFKAEHDPDGIGKFYLGREIAHVMGHRAAIWLERPEREEEEKLSLLIQTLGLKPGMVVADIGAGSGRISMLIGDEVGPTGKVLAVDIQKEMLDIIRGKIEKYELTNIEPVMGTVKSPQLKPESVDLVVMVDVYHEFSFPYEMLKEISDSLKPCGRLAFVEYRLENPEIRIKRLHKMSQRQVKKEAAWPEFKLKWRKTIHKLPQQHVIVFTKQ